ncbi:phosphatase PAP2 family protein [Haladaptatus sp. NG-SE-30]
MTRGWGIVEALRELLPIWVRELFVFVTQLGDAWLLFLIGALLYWFGDDRERFGFVIAATLGGLSLTLALKGFFARPRPPHALQFVHASGYGYPSGHAIGSTVFWGALAVTIDRWKTWLRVTGAGVVVALVALSRLVLGVHFAVDVLVGVVVGVAYLAIVVKGLDRRPVAAFALAVVSALAAVLIAFSSSATGTVGLRFDSIAALGGTTGALLTWMALGPPNEGVSAPKVVVGLLSLGGLSYLGLEWPLPLVAVFGINAIVQGGMLAYPKIAGEKETSDREIES